MSCFAKIITNTLKLRISDNIITNSIKKVVTLTTKKSMVQVPDNFYGILMILVSTKPSIRLHIISNLPSYSTFSKWINQTKENKPLIPLAPPTPKEMPSRINTVVKLKANGVSGCLKKANE